MGYQVGLVLLCRPRTRSLDETEALEEEGEVHRWKEELVSWQWQSKLEGVGEVELHWVKLELEGVGEVEPLHWEQ